ncbi:hypothetical protein FRC0037_01931 [Corynebacterium diphtheriae]|nr:hypothetical protein FRC0037_01931 [Corynebacterium diphtheriae]
MDVIHAQGLLLCGGGVGSLVLGTILTAMRVSPVGVLRSISTEYINIVCNTPLTLVVLFCSFGLYKTLRLQLVSREPETLLATNNFRLAVLGLSFTQTFRFLSFRRHYVQRLCRWEIP